MMNKRVNYIDNVRTILVLSLIVFHLAVAYNSWGEANYIFFERSNPIAGIVVFMNPWFMPMMFLLAGISASYSLRKRSAAHFVKERLLRLGIPFVFGILFLNPVLSFVADRAHNGYKGNYFEHYRIYFTKFTDLTGYDGGFTLGHLWFVGWLIIVSLISLLVIYLVRKISGKNVRVTYIVLNVLLVIGAVAFYDLKIGGKPLISFFFVYLLGYYLFSSEAVVERIVKLKWVLTALFVAVSLANVILFVYLEKLPVLNTITNYLAFVLGILTLLCLGREYLNKSCRLSSYAASNSYVFYIIHYPITVLCQYFLNMGGMNYIGNFFLSIAIAYALTGFWCWLIDKSSYIRFLFGRKAR